jgi:hypothetical protein
MLSARALATTLAVRDTGAADAPKPLLLDRVHETSRPATTMIYTHALTPGPAGVQSAADRTFR